MTIQQTIQKAIEGGYQDCDGFTEGQNWMIWFQKSGKDILAKSEHSIFLDPQFWQCLGKIMGWNKEIDIYYKKFDKKLKLYHTIYSEKCEGWHYYWHCFIDYLAEGKSIESYFENIL